MPRSLVRPPSRFFVINFYGFPGMSVIARCQRPSTISERALISHWSAVSNGRSNARVGRPRQLSSWSRTNRGFGSKASNRFVTAWDRLPPQFTPPGRPARSGTTGEDLDLGTWTEAFDQCVEGVRFRGVGAGAWRTQQSAFRLQGLDWLAPHGEDCVFGLTPQPHSRPHPLLDPGQDGHGAEAPVLDDLSAFAAD